MNECGAVSYEENNMSGFVNSFAGAVSSFPVEGPIVAGLIQPTYSIRQLKCLPGNNYDMRTFYATENVLIVVTLLLMGIALFVSRK